MKIFRGEYNRWFIQAFDKLTGTPLPQALCPEFATRDQARYWVRWKRTGKYNGKHPEKVRAGLKCAGVKRPNRKKKTEHAT